MEKNNDETNDETLEASLIEQLSTLTGLKESEEGTI